MPTATACTGRHGSARRNRSPAAAIGRDYRAECDDLARKYALRTPVGWVQTLEPVASVYPLTVQLRRRKAERVLAMDVSAGARHLEVPPCEATWSRERPRLVCDEALHLLCAAGLAASAGCGRPYCRACHTHHCPKCGREGTLSAFAGSVAGASPAATA